MKSKAKKRIIALILGLLLLIPIVNIVIGIMLDIKLAKAYGGGVGMILLCIFLPTIAYLILGFGGAEYIGPQ